MALGLGLIIAIILFKYKPTYVVSLCGEQIGYVSNAAELQNRIQSEIIDMDGENIDFVTLDNMPKYELKLVEKSLTTNEDEIMLALKDDAKVIAIPEIIANNVEANLIHEAAIGKIAGEQLIKLMTLGLTEKEAEEQIISGFLK